MTTTMTITEGLAELKTMEKRIAKKREYISNYLGRQEGHKDPLERDGGSAEVIRRELQAIGDLQERHLKMRVSIQQSNHQTFITVGTVMRTVAEWLTWRKEIAPEQQVGLAALRQNLLRIRQQSQQKGYNVVSGAVAVSGETKPTDIIINVDEALLAANLENIEYVLGTLDGQLSLKNATVMITV